MASFYLLERRQFLIDGAEKMYQVQVATVREELDVMLEEIRNIVYTEDVVKKVSGYLSKEEKLAKVKPVQEKIKQAIFEYDDMLEMAERVYRKEEAEYNQECQEIMDGVYDWLKPELLEWLEKDFEQWKKTQYIQSADVFSRRSWNFCVMPGHIETDTGTGNMFLFSLCGIPGFQTIGKQTGAAIAIAEFMQGIIQEKVPFCDVTYAQNDNKIYFNL